MGDSYEQPPQPGMPYQLPPASQAGAPPEVPQGPPEYSAAPPPFPQFQVPPGRPDIGAEGLFVPVIPGGPGAESAFPPGPSVGAHVDLRNVVSPARMRNGGKDREPSSEDVPFDVWAASVVPWENGSFVATIHRRKPTQYVIDGRQHYTGGRLGEMHECPTEGKIAALFGGGDGHCEIVGPGPNGQPKHYGSRTWEIAAEPKPMDRGSDHNDSRGSSMSDNLAGKVIDVLDRKLTEAERYRGASDGRSGMSPELLDLAREAGQSRAAVDAARYSTEAQYSQQRVQQLEEELRAARAAANNGQGSVGETLAGVRGLMEALRPPEAPTRSNGSGYSDDQVEHYKGMLRDYRERADREMESLRKLHEERIQALRDDNRRALDQVREDHRAAVERDRDTAKGRLDDAETRHRSELDRVRETERSAAAAAGGAKDARIEMLQHELDRVRDDGRKDLERERDARRVEIDREREDKRDWRAKAESAEAKNNALLAQVAKLEAELAHRPSEPKGFAGQVKEIASTKKAIQDLFGKDDDDDDEKPTAAVGGIIGGLRDILDHPVIEGLAKRGFDAFSGQAEADRKKEIELQKLQVVDKKNDNVARLKYEELQVKKLEAAKALGLRAPGADAQAKVSAASPAPTPTTAPPSGQPAGAPAMVRSPYYEAGDPPLPDSPVKREISGQLEGFKGLLFQVELTIRKGGSAEQYVDAMAAEVPLEIVRDKILAQFPTHSDFLTALADEGADKAFPPLYHPIGRRFLKDLWAIVEARVGKPGVDAINAAKGDDEDEDDD